MWQNASPSQRQSRAGLYKGHTGAWHWSGPWLYPKAHVDGGISTLLSSACVIKCLYSNDITASSADTYMDVDVRSQASYAPLRFYIKYHKTSGAINKDAMTSRSLCVESERDTELIPCDIKTTDWRVVLPTTAHEKTNSKNIELDFYSKSENIKSI